MSFGHMRRKNWKKICEIEDPHFRTALALLDMNSEFALGVINSRLFGDYFEPEMVRDEKNGYPVPLSILFTLARADAIIRDGGDAGDTDKLICYDHLWEKADIHLPLIWFARTADSDWGDGEIPLLPKEIKKQVEIKYGEEIWQRTEEVSPGTVFTWEKKEVVLLEDHRGCGYMVFVPGDCIAVDK
ncbi:MAG: hypothetical protein H8D63_00230 [Parcubacteria group bacterium]|nr:hypothetical protein [Parcubacteria group bacterium]